jgi:hypothetical protein
LFDAKPENWWDARENCDGLTIGTTRLAVLRDQGDADVIRDLMDDNSNAWIGLHQPVACVDCVGPDYGFEWVDSSVTSFTRWVDGQPNNAPDPVVGEQDCGHFYSDYNYDEAGLADNECIKDMAYVCELEWEYSPCVSSAPSLSPTPVMCACPGGWKEADTPGYCYKIIDEIPLSWEVAAAFCSSYNVPGAQLATFHCKEDADVIFDCVGTNQILWVGLYQTSTGAVHEPDENWEWIDGRKICTDCTPWVAGQPNNRGENGEAQNCGYYWTHEAKFKSGLADGECTSEYHFVCEIPWEGAPCSDPAPQLVV